jgi:hypothetical protein
MLVFVVLCAMGIPSFGKVRGVADDGATTAGVTVERHEVGDFDVAVIAGAEGAGVAGWLEQNGFALDTASRAVAVEHAAAGGWFVASRVRREFAESGRSVPAPLAFRFAVKQPVYPMRLTGAGARGALAVELVVFGPARAEAPGMTVRTVAPLTYAKANVWEGRRSVRQPKDSRRVAHPELVRWTQGATAATWMRGTLTPTQMQADLAITWGEEMAVPQGLYAFSVEDALGRALLLGAAVAFLGAVVLGLKYGNKRLPPKWCWGIVSVAVVGGGVLLGVTPVAAVMSQAESRARTGLPWHERRTVAMAAQIALIDLPRETGDAEVQTAFMKELDGYFHDDYRKSQIGDTPGELELRKQSDGRWQVWFYDSYGQPFYLKDMDAELRPSAETKNSPGTYGQGKPQGTL